MLSTLTNFDRLTAAGILARAALSIEDESNPAGAFRIEDEKKIRESLLFEARTKLGIQQKDLSLDILEKIGDMLDYECEILLGRIDDTTALNNMAAQGELPSDLFKVEIIKEIANFHGKKFQTEEKFIKETISNPDKEQHFGPPENKDEPFLISLFAKHFTDKYSHRSFTMLVAGQRKGTLLNVHQAWRVYTDIVNLVGTDTLVEMLERFSDVFGAKIQIGDKIGHFFLLADIPNNQTHTRIKIITDVPKEGEKVVETNVTVTYFGQPSSNGNNKIALAVAIDLLHYARVLKSRGW